MNANGPAQPGVPPRAVGGDAPARSPDDTLAVLVRDRAVVVAALLDAGSGMLLTSRSRDGAPEDLETVCAGQADVIRAALDAARVSIGGPEPTEVVVAHGDRLHQLLRTVHDPLGDRLVLSLLVEGPPRALRRVRRRLGRIDTAALVPLPLSGPAAPSPGADLFTPAQSGTQGPWWAGDGVRAAPPAGATPAVWNGAGHGTPRTPGLDTPGPGTPAPGTSAPGTPGLGTPGGAVPVASGGFSAEVIDSAIEATVRIAARAPAAPEQAASTPAAVPTGDTAGQPAPADAEPVTTALPLVQDRTTEPAVPGPHTITVTLGSNPAALPARPAAPAAPAVAPAVAAPAPVPAPAVPVPSPVPATPATPVAMPAVPARPAEPARPLPSTPAAMPAATSGRAAGWSTASVLGHGAGPGGAPTATDVVEALDRVATDDSLSGSALFTGVVPAEPPPPVDDPPPPLTWDAGPPPAAPTGPAPAGPAAVAPTDGPEPHPWFGGRHAAPDGAAPAATAAPGPGRHTTTGTNPAAPAAPAAPPVQAPGRPTASAVRPAAQPPLLPDPRAAEMATPVDRVVAAALQGAGRPAADRAVWGGAPPSSTGSLFEPVRRTQTDASAVPGRVDSAPVGPGEDRGEDRDEHRGTAPADAGRDGGNRVDPGR